MPGRLLLALDPAMLALQVTPAAHASFAAADGLHRWDLAMLCSSLPRHKPVPTSRLAAARSARSLTSLTSMPVGCQQLAVTNGDDDAFEGDTAMNWTTGAVHCSHAGLTAIPPLPANAQNL